jgi:hypothetical protein
MRKRQRVILRTQTYERILIRRKDCGPRLCKDSESSVGESLPGTKYRLEIHRIEAWGEQVVFECELSGRIEFVKT